MLRTILEAVLFLALASGLGLLANAVHVAGIDLQKDYFPQGPLEVVPPEGDPEAESEAIRREIEELGFQVLDTEELHQWVLDLQDPAMGLQDTVVILDGRRRSAWEAGHVPGALSCDRYQLDRALEELEPVLRSPELMMAIIYCASRTCEDALFLARELVYERGLLSADQVQVFLGGWQAWEEAHPELIERAEG